MTPTEYVETARFSDYDRQARTLAIFADFWKNPRRYLIEKYDPKRDEKVIQWDCEDLNLYLCGFDCWSDSSTAARDLSNYGKIRNIEPKVHGDQHEYNFLFTMTSGAQHYIKNSDIEKHFGAFLYYLIKLG